MIEARILMAGELFEDLCRPLSFLSDTCNELAPFGLPRILICFSKRLRELVVLERNLVPVGQMSAQTRDRHSAGREGGASIHEVSGSKAQSLRGLKFAGSKRNLGLREVRDRRVNAVLPCAF